MSVLPTVVCGFGLQLLKSSSQLTFKAPPLGVRIRIFMRTDVGTNRTLSGLCRESSFPQRRCTWAPFRSSSSSGDDDGEKRTAPSGFQRNYYDELGLDISASSQDIKKAYYDMSKKYHPDLNPDDPEALKRFQDISAAHETLGNPRQRRSYDRKTLGRSTSVADEEAGMHTFEGESFYEGRAAHRGDGKSVRNSELDYWINQTRKRTFHEDQLRKNTSGGIRQRTNKERKQAEEFFQISGKAVFLILVVTCYLFFKLL